MLKIKILSIRYPRCSIGFIPGSVGETSTLLIILGALVLIFTKIGSWRIMLVQFVGALVMGVIFNLVVDADIDFRI